MERENFTTEGIQIWDPNFEKTLRTKVFMLDEDYL